MAFLFFSIASCSFLLAEDWNQFRGPSGQGHAEWNDLPVKWDRKNSVDWKTELPGKAWSSPIIVGSSLVLTNAIEEEGGLALEVLALDSVSGKKKWSVILFEHDDCFPDPASICRGADDVLALGDCMLPTLDIRVCDFVRSRVLQHSW